MRCPPLRSLHQTTTMKKNRVVLLVLLCALLLFFTLILQYISIEEPARRVAVNLGTLSMAAAYGALLAFVYHGTAADGQTKRGEDSNPGQMVFDKERYLAFAAEHGFTRRETEVGLLVANGFTNLQIAEELFIAETTVKKHITHIFEKSGLSGRKEFTAFFMTHV